MKPLHISIAAGAALAVALALGAFAPASAQPQGSKQASKTPDAFPYEIVNGRRVPRGKKNVNADGSWREEIKDGPCVTLKEQSQPGEYREVRKCD
jgi:ABC-type glycerol-3-phosphate transport system substrate-binding protein